MRGMTICWMARAPAMGSGSANGGRRGWRRLAIATARSWNFITQGLPLQTSLFNYDFPKDLVAQHPLPERDSSKMMVLDRASRSWSHHKFREFPGRLQSGD